jgi:hypothetical protein
MRTDHRDQGRRLGKVVDHLEADTNLHTEHQIQLLAHMGIGRRLRLEALLLCDFEAAVEQQLNA